MSTSCNFRYYPFSFVMRSVSSEVSCLIYHFKSTVTNQWYIVRAEEYPNHFYGVKFYLKSDSNNPHKYNRLTYLNEPRMVINTCIAIMLEIVKSDEKSSFGFIGANIEGESNVLTKRFRVYRRILTSYFSEEVFYHYQIEEKSAYAMVRRGRLEADEDLIEKISTYFSDHYSDFD